MRILHGQVFARDFFEVMGPGTFYMLAGFFKLFGPTFFADRIWLFVTSLGTASSMYFLSRRVCKKYRILPVAPAGGGLFQHGMADGEPSCGQQLFFAARCRLRGFMAGHAQGKFSGCRRRSGRSDNLHPAAEGDAATAGFAAMALHTAVAAIFVDVFAVRSRCGLLLPSSELRLLYFWSRGALRDLMYMNFVWPSQNYGTLNAIPYATGIVQFWAHWVMPIHGVRWLIPLAVVLILPFLLVAALPALVPILGIPRWQR